jgi:hypothetical protein
MNEEYVERRPGDLEMYRRLDAYAETRLAPDAAAMARIRAALMGHAVAMADAGAATMALPLQPATTLPQGPFLALRRPKVSRWSAAFLAACLCLGLVAGSVAASAAGGPFYGPRLWLEEATLPSAPLAHAHGQLDRLDARLDEIRVATANRNAGAVEAALLAYAEIVDDLEAQAMGNPAVAADVLDDLAHRQMVLIALMGKVPPQAQDALAHALQQGANAVEVIAEDGNPGDPVRGRGGGTTNQGDSGGTGNNGGGGGGRTARTSQTTLQMSRGPHQSRSPLRSRSPRPSPRRWKPSRRLRKRRPNRAAEAEIRAAE